MRLIDADEFFENYPELAIEPYINAPTVDIPCNDCCADTYRDGYEKGKADARTQGECKTCKYYHPYYAQFSNKPRGDGYCVIARMTPEGMTTINCNDEFGCASYQKGGAE